MTYEQKVVVSLEDIKAICFQCKSCGAKICISPDSGLVPPDKCLQCHEPWMQKASSTPIANGLYQGHDSSLTKLVKAVAAMRNQELSGTFGFRVLLEFDAKN